MKKRKINLIKLGILLFGISLFLQNCENDFETNQIENIINSKKLNYTLEKINYEKLLKDKEIQYSLKLLKNKFSNVKKQQNLYSKETTQVADGLTLITDEINKITVNQTITWTFQIETPAFDTSIFENFMVKKHNDVFSYYLISYELNDEENTESIYEKALLYEISEEYLTLDDLDLALRDVFDWAPTDDESGGGGQPCDGVNVYDNCDKGGSPNGHDPACQDPPACTEYCSSSPLLYIDFSHCNDETYSPPNGPSNNLPDPTSGGTTGGGGTPNDSDTPTVTIPVTFQDPACPSGSGKRMINNICVCPEDKIENEKGICVCPEGYKPDSRGDCIKEGHCFELDKILFGTSSENPYIQNGSPNDPTGENTHLRIAITNIKDGLNSNWEQGYAFYNRGNFPEYGPYAHHYKAQEQSHVTFPGRIYQFGTIHTHPVNDEAIPMFSHDDLYSLLKIRNLYGSGSSIYANNNLAGDDLFLNVLVVQQAGQVKTYAIKISDTSKLQALEAIRQNERKWKKYGKNLSRLYSENASGINGSAEAYQKVFLQFVKNQDLGLDLYEMEQVNAGTLNVQEKWKKLSLSGDGNTVIEEPCNNN